MKYLFVILKSLRSLSFLRYGSRLSPARDWLFVLALSSLLFLGSVVWNISIFLRVAEGGILGTNLDTAPIDSSTPLIDAHELFETRAEEALRYEREYRFVDPSR